LGGLVGGVVCGHRQTDRVFFCRVLVGKSMLLVDDLSVIYNNRDEWFGIGEVHGNPQLFSFARLATVNEFAFPVAA